ncbi:phosphoribosylformylglycinamidine synthase II, partial [Rhizobium johnstonii]
TTDDLRFRVMHQGEEVANLPIMDLGDQAPEYDRPLRESGKRAPLPANLVAAPEDYGQALRQLVGSANQSSRRWVYE